MFLQAVEVPAASDLGRKKMAPAQALAPASIFCLRLPALSYARVALV